jgi:hypothetical protein
VIRHRGWQRRRPTPPPRRARWCRSWPRRARARIHGTSMWWRPDRGRASGRQGTCRRSQARRPCLRRSRSPDTRSRSAIAPRAAQRACRSHAAAALKICGMVYTCVCVCVCVSLTTGQPGAGVGSRVAKLGGGAKSLELDFQRKKKKKKNSHNNRTPPIKEHFFPT